MQRFWEKKPNYDGATRGATQAIMKETKIKPLSPRRGRVKYQGRNTRRVMDEERIVVETIEARQLI